MDTGLLERPPVEPEVAPAKPGLQDGNPAANARGQFRGPGPVQEPEVQQALERRIARDLARIAKAEAIEEADGETSAATAGGIDEIPLLGWAVAGAEAGVAIYQGVELYRAYKDLREAQKELEDAKKKQAASATDTNVKVRGKCLVDEYQKLTKVCGGEAHHIIPDMVYRLGARPETAAAMNSTADRIPNAPTFNQGMAICLTEAQHAGLHGSLRTELNGLGAAQTPRGTAPFGKIAVAANGSIAAIPNLPAECKALAASKLASQLKQQGLKMSQPGRTQQSPLPSGEAETVLRQGHY